MGIPERMRSHISQCSSKDAVTETPAFSLRALPTTVSHPVPVSNPTNPQNKKLKFLGDMKTFVRIQRNHIQNKFKIIFNKYNFLPKSIK